MGWQKGHPAAPKGNSPGLAHKKEKHTPFLPQLWFKTECFGIFNSIVFNETCHTKTFSVAMTNYMKRERWWCDCYCFSLPFFCYIPNRLLTALCGFTQKSPVSRQSTNRY